MKRTIKQERSLLGASGIYGLDSCPAQVVALPNKEDKTYLIHLFSDSSDEKPSRTIEAYDLDLFTEN